MSKLSKQDGNHKQKLLEKRDFWYNTIVEWQKDPISPREFCKSRGLSVDNFHYWKRKIFNQKNTKNDDVGKFVELNVANNLKDKISTIPNNLEKLDKDSAVIEICGIHNIPSIKITVAIPCIGNVITQIGGKPC